MIATMRTGPLSHYELAALRIQAFAALKDWGSTGDDGVWKSWNWPDRAKNADELVGWALTQNIADLPVAILTPMVAGDLYPEAQL